MLNSKVSTKHSNHTDLDHFFYDPDYITYSDIITFIRRYQFTLITGVVAGIAVAMIYISTSTPLYTARAQLFIDPTSTRFLEERRAEITLDAAQMQNQIELMKSDKIVWGVIRQLNLLDDKEFRAGLGNTEDGQIQPSDYEKKRHAIAALQQRLDVRRSGVSHIIDVSVKTQDPDKSARIANELAEFYIRDQIEARAETARQSSEWLENRIQNLRIKLNEAASTLQKLKSGRSDPSSLESGEAGAATTVASLEATVDAYRKIYEGYYQAFTNKVEQQSFPVANARLITPAAAPLDNSHPRSKLILAFGLFAGSLFGLGFAAIRHVRDGSARTPKQIKERIGLDCIARIPRLPDGRTTLQKLHITSVVTSEREQRRQIFRHAVDTPFSQFAGAVKALRTAISKAGGQDGIHTLGVVSSLPGEGKSTLVTNLAEVIALSSQRVLLIDADLHNSVISETLAPSATCGLLEVLGEGADPMGCIVIGDNGAPDIMPVFLPDKSRVSYDLVGSKNMQALLKELEGLYDIILIDMPPLTPIADGIMLSGILDGLLLAVEWGGTPLDVLTEVAYGLHLADANILGVVLTKVDESAVHLRLQKTWNYY